MLKNFCEGTEDIKYIRGTEPDYLTDDHSDQCCIGRTALLHAQAYRNQRNIDSNRNIATTISHIKVVVYSFGCYVGHYFHYIIRKLVLFLKSLIVSNITPKYSIDR